MNRYACLTLAGALTLGLGAAPRDEADLLIRGGIIYPGGKAAFVGDIAVKDDRILAVGKRLNIAAKRAIDARGMIVAPGFIDPHTHVEGMLESGEAKERLVLPFLMQGVTTAFIGNDGGGGLDVAETLASASTKPVGINYATYVGFGSVRSAVTGQAKRAPDASELARMKGLVDTAMCQGALGLSTGLFYAPQSFSDTAEVAAVARAAGARGGFYDSHIRDESSYNIGLKAAIAEAIEIGRIAKMPVHISHIKALGVDVQGQAPAIIAMVEKARAKGQKVTADQYPWSASGTSLVASLMPLWAQDGGRPAMLKRLDTPADAARIKTDMAENLRRRGGPASLLITEGPLKGKRLSDIAAGGDPVEGAIGVIRESDPAVASFNQSEPDIKAFMARPWVMTGSDASTGHPRVYGSFARKYAYYVMAEHTLTLRQFIDRSSALAADTFGLTGRGHIKMGYFADIVIFDPNSYAAAATYEQPTLFALGVKSVIVNGSVAVDEGQATGIAAGRALPRTPKGQCPT